MADVTLHHPQVEQAAADMQQATMQMSNALDDLETGMSAMASTFSGQSADAWREFQAAANRAEIDMQAAFGHGAIVLTQMHETHKRADHHGANLYS